MYRGLEIDARHLGLHACRVDEDAYGQKSVVSISECSTSMQKSLRPGAYLRLLRSCDWEDCMQQSAPVMLLAGA